MQSLCRMCWKNTARAFMVMSEEIFGPIMPIIAFDDFDTVVDELKKQVRWALVVLEKAAWALIMERTTLTEYQKYID